MPRVLIAGFCAFPGPNRAGVQLRHVLRALAPHHSVDALVVRRGEQAYVERHGTVRMLRVPLQGATLRQQVDGFRRALRRQLEGADYDIVHFRDGWSGIPVLELRERLRYAAVFDASRAPLAEPQLLQPELAAELSRDEEACLLDADLVLAPTEAARRYVAARGRPDRVRLAPPGVDVDQFDWDEPPVDGPRRVLCAGALEPGRGVRVLLRAMVEVARRTEAVLTLAGPSSPGFEQTVRKAIDDLALGARVQLRGEVEHEQMPALVARATVCVAPAALELGPRPMGLYPTKLLEYMACRRAVVAPRRGSVSGLLHEGKHGLLFNPGDPLDLARQLLLLLDQVELRQRLADAGYALVRGHHTASAARRCIRAAYAALCRRSPWRERFAEAASADTGPTDRSPTAAVGSHELGAFPPTDLGAGLSEDAIGAITAPGEITRVELRAQPRDQSDSGELPALGAADGADHPDHWVVSERRGERLDTDTAGGRDDEEGTPVDVAPAPGRASSPLGDNRFAAGEVEVPTPAPEIELDLDEETAFTAVSVLLGGAEEEPGAPAATPAREKDRDG